MVKKESHAVESWNCKETRQRMVPNIYLQLRVPHHVMLVYDALLVAIETYVLMYEPQ